MTYNELSVPGRSLVILMFFLIVCVGGCLIPGMVRRKKIAEGIFLGFGIAISAVLMIIYTAQARAVLRTLEVPAVSAWLCEQSLVFPVVWGALTAVYFACLEFSEIRFRKNTITKFSIKEGVDKISSGLCFYEEGGRVILANSRMIELSHRLTGMDLQNAEQFWKVLSGGEARKGVTRLSFGSFPNFRLPDGSVWTFSREELDGFIQLTAADTTLQQSLTDELMEKNLDLAAMNLRLKRYGENVDELTRTKERLETKVRIHGELGQALLATRRYLAGGEGGEAPVEAWRRNIAMLHNELEARKVEDPLKILEKAAKAAFIELRIKGELPEKPELRQFFLTAASEAMANAVLHANAKMLMIEISGDGDVWKMRFTNDGDVPESPITEGGGLGSLRRKAEYIGATMRVDTGDAYVLTIEGRKEW